MQKSKCTPPPQKNKTKKQNDKKKTKLKKTLQVSLVLLIECVEEV